MAITVGTVISLGLAAAVVDAQPSGYGMGWGGGHMGGYGGPGYGMMGGNGHGFGMGPGMMDGYGPGYGMGPQAMVNGYPGNAEESLADMKTLLGLTEKQDSAWQAFVTNAKKQDENRQAWFAKMQQARSAGATPELMAQQTDLLKQRETELRANTTALKNLYAVLTPEQKTVADQAFGGFGPRGNQVSRGGPRGYSR